jgi:hypothetical protein
MAAGIAIWDGLLGQAADYRLENQVKKGNQQYEHLGRDQLPQPAPLGTRVCPPLHQIGNNG